MMYDLVGIGAGPFSLSLAALLEPTDLKTCFLERQKKYQWHPGMLLPGAKLQNSFLRDLVTGVDPTNKNSFLNYLVESGRFYRFLHADQSAVSRQEFNMYLQWASNRMQHVHSGCEVREVNFDESQLCFQTTLADNRQILSQHLSLGTGKRPKVPSFAKPLLGDKCFHASETALRKPDMTGQRVAVIGGGQSGAEIFLNLISANWGEPEAVTWISRRNNLAPLDESPFTNDFFAPAYHDVFKSIADGKKDQLLAEQKLASDGISPETLRDIYQSLYQREITQGLCSKVQIKPSRELKGIAKSAAGMEISYLNQIDDQTDANQADYVVLCTGYEYHLPSYLQPLSQHLDCDPAYGMSLDKHYRIDWHGGTKNHIYGLNAGLLSHGIVDPQMSLNAVRAATIVNDLTSRSMYRIGDESYIQWQTQGHSEQIAAA